MNLNAILKKELVFFSGLESKKDNLEALIQLFEEKKLVDDVEVLRQSVFSREELMSTGIGLGIAVPHVRVQGVENINIAININKKGITDYESLDGIPVRIIIMIVAAEKQHSDYLKVLSQIVKILKKNSKISRLLKTKKPEEVIALILEDFEEFASEQVIN